MYAHNSSRLSYTDTPEYTSSVIDGCPTWDTVSVPRNDFDVGGKLAGNLIFVAVSSTGPKKSAFAKFKIQWVDVGTAVVS